MINSTFRVRVCHATRVLIVQFALKSNVLTERQRKYLLCGGVK